MLIRWTACLKSLVSWERITFSTNFRGYFSFGFTRVTFLTCKVMLCLSYHKRNISDWSLSTVYGIVLSIYVFLQSTFFLWSRMILASMAEAATTPTPTSIGTSLIFSWPLPSILNSFYTTLKQWLQLSYVWKEGTKAHIYWFNRFTQVLGGNMGEQSSAEIILPNSWLRPITMRSTLYLTCWKEKRLEASYKVHCIFSHQALSAVMRHQSVATTKPVQKWLPGHHNCIVSQPVSILTIHSKSI